MTTPDIVISTIFVPFFIACKVTMQALFSIINWIHPNATWHVKFQNGYVA